MTLVTSILSALTGRPVRQDIAMTGEITLRGRVLKIGGLKEKVIAAHRNRIRKIIIPAENEAELEEINEEIRKDLEFIPVHTVDEVLAVAMCPLPKPQSPKKNPAPRGPVKKSPARGRVRPGVHRSA